MENIKPKTNETTISRKIIRGLLIFIGISLVIIAILAVIGPSLAAFLTPILYPN